MRPCLKNWERKKRMREGERSEGGDVRRGGEGGEGEGREGKGQEREKCLEMCLYRNGTMKKIFKKPFLHEIKNNTSKIIRIKCFRTLEKNFRN